MGKPTKLISDPSLGRAHQKGAGVSVLQVLTHDRYGAVAYLWPRHWALHFQSAQSAHDRLCELHQSVLALPVDASGMRSIYDIDLIQAFYQTGCQMVIETILAVQHLCEEIERGSETAPNQGDLPERLDTALTAGKLKVDKKSRGYAAFVELLKIRNAIEHPKSTNTYSGDPNSWDHVPLAWIISDRSLKAFANFGKFFDQLVDRWTARSKELARPMAFNMQRGIRSTRQHKKPPRM